MLPTPLTTVSTLVRTLLFIFIHVLSVARKLITKTIILEKNGVPVSPFHDIPLFANAEKTILNMIVEIPRWTNAKLEVMNLFECNALRNCVC